MDRRGKIIALVAVKRPYDDADATDVGHGRLLKGVQFVTTNDGEERVEADLAKMENLSPSQLTREFGRLSGITPNHYLREVRVGVARHLLESTGQPISRIAITTGLYDQSHFTRQFKQSTGMTPTAYRKTFNFYQNSGSTS